MHCGKTRMYSHEKRAVCLEWSNIIANKSAKLRVESSFFNPMGVDPFLLGPRGSRIGVDFVLIGQMS